MAIRTVLCILPVKGYDKDLAVALEFCRKADAHLSLVPVCMNSFPIMGDYNALSSVWLEDRQQEVEDLGRTVEDIKKHILDSDISFDVSGVHTEVGLARREIGRRALYADVVLLGRNAMRDQEVRRQVLDGVLFGTSSPLVINRLNRAFSPAPKKIVLAWDSSNEAARAAREALSLIKAAENVFVTMVDPVAQEDYNGEEPGADVATFLTRHGVKVQVDRLPSGAGRVDEVLIQHATDIDADLIVMGAYNHPRWQQSILGGATRNMIDACPFPLLLAH
ncbi:universal stress protein [Rhizobium sp. Leaf311]|uniref:universal stress protein n=1 Tax=Rhizobium sp. Leaf311 TaxID=1736332 RepID=UPI000714F03D|nr:universal stress protein [Rhizobium sp. Leaf311]KQQ44873.1 universal stress protein [Rhizobium sp. Leaf311]